MSAVRDLSLSARIRALHLEPGLEAALVQMAEQLEHVAAYDQMIARARGPGRMPRHARDRHGLHVVRGFAVVALVPALRWVAAHRGHKLVATAAGLALAGGAVITPSVAPPIAQAPPAAHHHHHRRRPHPHHPLMAGPVPVVPQARTARRQHHHRAPLVTPTPTPIPTPVPSPSLTPVPTPGPLPSVLPSTLPSVLGNTVNGIVHDLRKPRGLLWRAISAERGR